MGEKTVLLNRPCPVCGGVASSQLFPVNLYAEDMGLPNSYNVVRCDCCGMCYADTSADENAYENYYGQFNFYANPPSHSTLMKQSTKERFELIEKMLFRYSGKEQAILDAGFGHGELLRFLKSRGFLQLTGMDPSQQSVENIKKDGIESFCGSLQEEIHEHKKGKYDVVITTDVLEHLFLPQKSIQNIKKLLKPDGYVILTLPVFDDLAEYHLPLANIINQEHINYFSPVSLRCFMENNGFSEIQTEKVIIEKDEHSLTRGVLAVYRSNNSVSLTFSQLYVDAVTGNIISEYYRRQKQALKSYESFLNILYQNKIPTAIWGTGAYLRFLWCETLLSKCNVHMLIDGSDLKQGETFSDYVIQSPETLKNFDGVLLITAVRYQEEIIKKARNIWFQGKIKVFPSIIS